MEGKDKSGSNKMIIAAGIAVLAVVLFALLLVTSIVMYVRKSALPEVRESMTGSERERFSKMAFLPDLGDDFERYAVGGFRDPVYTIETGRFGSLDEMIAVLPEGSDEGIRNSVAEAGNYEGATDLDGKSVGLYHLIYEIPFAGPAEIGSDYDIYQYNFVDYSILEYEDGTYRFRIEIAVT